CLGKSISQQIEDPSEDSDGTQGCGSISWSEDDREQVLLALVVELQRADDRQVAPRVVMAVEEAQLLVPMSGIVGGVEVNGDSARFALEPLGVMADHRVAQLERHSVEALA